MYAIRCNNQKHKMSQAAANLMQEALGIEQKEVSRKELHQESPEDEWQAQLLCTLRASFPHECYELATATTGPYVGLRAVGVARQVLNRKRAANLALALSKQAAVCGKSKRLQSLTSTMKELRRTCALRASTTTHVGVRAPESACTCATHAL